MWLLYVLVTFGLIASEIQTIPVPLLSRFINHDSVWEDVTTYCRWHSGVTVPHGQLPHNRSIPPRNCKHLMLAGQSQSGMYTLYRCVMRMPVAIPVYCDMETDGGGWTVIQRRMDGSVNFFRNWTDYKQGFGDINGEFWLGNDYISLLTIDEDQELRIDLEDFGASKKYAKFNKFKVQPEYTYYRMNVTGYSGTAGGSYFTGLNEAMFSTKDRDNDGYTRRDYANYHRSGWWFKYNYPYSNLNGEYLAGSYSGISSRGVTWADNWSSSYSLKKSEMKIRPARII